jgi:hypothetical protein
MPAAIRASGALGNAAPSLTSACPPRSSWFVHHLATGRSPPRRRSSTAGLRAGGCHSSRGHRATPQESSLHRTGWTTRRRGRRHGPASRSERASVLDLTPVRAVARRAPGGPPKAEPGADAGPAAPRSGAALTWHGAEQLNLIFRQLAGRHDCQPGRCPRGRPIRRSSAPDPRPAGGQVARHQPGCCLPLRQRGRSSHQAARPTYVVSAKLREFIDTEDKAA